MVGIGGGGFEQFFDFDGIDEFLDEFVEKRESFESLAILKGECAV